MSVLLSVRELSHSFHAQPLFKGVGFTLSEGDRVGLIGPNGAGKSTLLAILAGKLTADAGEVTKRAGLRVALLEQIPELEGETVRDAVRTRVNRTHGAEWEQESLIDEWLNRLELDASQCVASLSGGWQKRVALAQAFINEPDLLLLDEPTNHLDVESILWLERSLAGARFATLTVTHDRLFLQRVSNRILELDRRNPGGLLDVKGDYSTYVERKAEAMATQERREQTLKNALRRETEWLRRGAAARSTKQQARIQRAENLAQAVGELEQRNRKESISLDFQETGAKRPKRFIEARRISKSYDGKTVFHPLDLLISNNTRLGLLGPNGSGKSTLLKVLTGQEAPTTGEVVRADPLEIAYFEQDRAALDPEATLADTVCPEGDYVVYRGSPLHRSAYLERFLFRSDQATQPVKSLSGGEQSRLLLACLMLKPAKVLILDEPTNDLDLQTLTMLEEALDDFDGAVLLVTHDRYFLDRVTDQILAFHIKEDERGQVTLLSGLEQWEQWHKTQVASKAVKNATANPKADPSKTGKRKKLSFRDQRDWDTLEERILEAEGRVTALEAECALPAVATDPERLRRLSEEMAQAREETDGLYARWAELEAALAES